MIVHPNHVVARSYGQLIYAVCLVRLLVAHVGKLLEENVAGLRLRVLRHAINVRILTVVGGIVVGCAVHLGNGDGEVVVSFKRKQQVLDVYFLHFVVRKSYVRHLFCEKCVAVFAGFDGEVVYLLHSIVGYLQLHRGGLVLPDDVVVGHAVKA